MNLPQPPRPNQPPQQHLNFATFRPDQHVYQMPPPFNDRWFAYLPDCQRGYVGRSKAEAVGLLVLGLLAGELSQRLEGGAS